MDLKKHQIKARFEKAQIYQENFKKESSSLTVSHQMPIQGQWWRHWSNVYTYYSSAFIVDYEQVIAFRGSYKVLSARTTWTKDVLSDIFT